jgi:uncharacterized protein (TIGR02271 family)
MRTDKRKDNGMAIQSDTTTIPIIEEKIRIDKEIVETGSVYVRKEVQEKQVNIEATLVQDNIHVERVPINQPVQNVPPAVRYEGDTMIVSVLQEELVIQKRLILVEEIRITKQKVENEKTHPVNIRKEEIFINSTRPDGEGSRERSDLK